MRKKPGTKPSHGDKVVKDIRRATRKQYILVLRTAVLSPFCQMLFSAQAAAIVSCLPLGRVPANLEVPLLPASKSGQESL